MSDAPLGTWHGVSTDAGGRVTEVHLSENNLSGPIPPEFGQLGELSSLFLSVNEITGSIPPEIGHLENLENLDLNFNDLIGSIPAEIGLLHNLRELGLYGNRIIGIPPEIGQLQRLRKLWLDDNGLTSSIPPEIGRLQNLETISLSYNKLTGDIPSEIGQLHKLTYLHLGANSLSGNIPTELGHLQNLEVLNLFENQLKGALPFELGQLQNLTTLYVPDNQLTGTIPSQIGQLRNLKELDLSSNRLTGTIPPELGQLSLLEDLTLSFNLLTGNVPNTFADLSNLKKLGLTENNAMSGALPLELARLELEELLLGGTGICVPGDAVIMDWLNAIPNSRVARCTNDQGRLMAYLTQATQSLSFPVPLVADEDALLRVFLTNQSDVDVVMPTVRASFHDRDSEVYSIDIPGNGVLIPSRISEGDLATTANARIPGSILTPELEMVVEIGPDGELDPSLGIASRLPPEGRTPLDVRVVPSFDLTLVPLLWTESPDYEIVNRVNALTEEDDLFRITRDLLPVADFKLNVREPIWVAKDPVHIDIVIQDVEAVYAMDGANGYYMGVLVGGGGGALSGTRVSVADLNNYVIAHELGHNMGLDHAPCGGPIGTDNDFPYPGGSIGAWGYDILNGELVSPDTPDLMSYCGPDQWISDYHFTKALAYRVSQERALLAAAYAPSSRSLLLWGGVGEHSELVLNPAFAVDAPASRPRLDGPYRITGEDQDGRTLFSLRFGMPALADVEDEGGSFAFVVPVRPDWPGRLSRIALTGPEGVATLGGENSVYDEEAPSTALLLDPGTGKVRGILRDWPGPSTTWQAARRALPEPGLEVVISRGIPDRADW